MGSRFREILASPSSRLNDAEVDIVTKYPIFRTIAVLAVFSLFAFSSFIGANPEFSTSKSGLISVLIGVFSVLAINIVSLTFAVVWKYLLGVALVEGFHRTLLAIYFLPISIAVIFLSIVFIGSIVESTN